MLPTIRNPIIRVTYNSQNVVDYFLKDRVSLESFRMDNSFLRFSDVVEDCCIEINTITNVEIILNEVF